MTKLSAWIRPPPYSFLIPMQQPNPPNLTLACECVGVFPDIKFMTEHTLLSFSKKYTYQLNLDSILESDHSLQNEQSKKHRIDIYLDFFKLGHVDKRELDWNANLEKVEIPEV